jgi:hypothetical protein
MIVEPLEVVLEGMIFPLTLDCGELLHSHLSPKGRGNYAPLPLRERLGEGE